MLFHCVGFAFYYESKKTFFKTTKTIISAEDVSLTVVNKQV